MEKIVVLEQSKIKDFLDKSFQYNSGAFLESQSLHGYLRDYNFSQYLKIVQQILESDNQALHQSVIRDLIHFLSSCSEEKQSDAWRNIAYLEDSLEYHGYLWDIAP
ncbi:hypothetical protein NON20_25115 (plasmid) [Synechocystis sp. B12]|nr:hypothetical protein NON20_25115 [Synechocystis sp. B12]